MSKLSDNPIFELIKGIFTSCIYMIIAVIPGIPLSWVSTMICRIAVSEPTITEHLVTGLCCLAAQCALVFFFFYRKGYDQKDDSLKLWKKVIVGAVVMHYIISLLFGFSVIIAGSAAVNIGEYIFLCIHPQTELPIMLANVPFYIMFISFTLVEIIYAFTVFFGIRAGKKKRRNGIE